MAWMMHFMAEYPEIQSRMQEEADQVLCDSETPDNFQNADKLRYIEAVAHETMRLKPVAPVLYLEPNEDVTIGGVDIPKHTMLMLPTRYGVMQESNFTAADKFQPERWLDSNPRQPAHNTKAFVPFGAGPRFCPGRNLAMLEIKMVMAMVCHNFSVSKSESARPIGERFAFTMIPEDLFINFSARLSEPFII